MLGIIKSEQHDQTEITKSTSKNFMFINLFFLIFYCEIWSSGKRVHIEIKWFQCIHYLMALANADK